MSYINKIDLSTIVEYLEYQILKDAVYSNILGLHALQHRGQEGCGIFL